MVALWGLVLKGERTHRAISAASQGRAVGVKDVVLPGGGHKARCYGLVYVVPTRVEGGPFHALDTMSCMVGCLHTHRGGPSFDTFGQDAKPSVRLYWVGVGQRDLEQYGGYGDSEG